MPGDMWVRMLREELTLWDASESVRKCVLPLLFLFYVWDEGVRISLCRNQCLCGRVTCSTVTVNLSTPSFDLVCVVVCEITGSGCGLVWHSVWAASMSL